VRAYRAEVDPEMVGLAFRAIVFVTMREGDRDTIAEFENAVAAVPEVVSAQRLFGDPDYLLHVVAADLAAYQLIYDEHLGTLPGVQRLTSTLVMIEVVHDRGLPLTAK
jgi:DNA-binding Lrp family transcriptional regulator